jgi:hypothetical protein
VSYEKWIKMIVDNDKEMSEEIIDDLLFNIMKIQKDYRNIKTERHEKMAEEIDKHFTSNETLRA